MLLFSFLPPVKIGDDGSIKINPLAKNHRFQRNKNYLVVDGFCKRSKSKYKCFYNQKGHFVFIDIKTSSDYYKGFLDENTYKREVSQKLTSTDNSLTVTCKYLVNSNSKKTLVKKTIVSVIKGITERQEITIENGKQTQKGEISRAHSDYWEKF